MNKNKSIKASTKSKKNIVAIILLMVLLVACIVTAIGTSINKVEAATNRAGAYLLSGSYDIGDGNQSGYLDRFNIQISTQNFYDDSANTTHHYSGRRYDWTYFNFYIYTEDIKEHVSFKLTKDGSTYYSKSLSGSDDMYLYQGSLPSGNYVLTYVGTYKPNWFVTNTYTFNYSFKVDKDAPSTTLKANGATISSGAYTNKAITYSFTDMSSSRLYYKSPSASSYSSTTATSKTISATTANNGIWRFYASDGYNTSSIVSVYLDTVAPVGSVKTTSGTALSSGSYTNKPFSYTATDTGGVSYLQVKYPGSSSWSSYNSGTACSSYTGWHYFRAIDKAGNISATYSIYYDATKPLGNVYGGTTAKASGSYTNASYVKYVASDANSGLLACYVRKPGSTTYVVYNSGTQLTTEGTYYFYCVDKSGNQSTIMSICLDRTASIGKVYGGTAVLGNGAYTNSQYVKYVASDSLSGIKACYVKMPGATYYTAYSSGTQLATEGTYHFYTIDKAGNRSTTLTATLDKTPATGVLYGGDAVVKSGGITNAKYIRFLASDNIGIRNIVVKMPGETMFVEYTNKAKLTEEGTYIFKIFDLAFNTSSEYTLTLDRQIPSAQLYVDGLAVSSGTYTNGDYISFQCVESSYVKLPESDSFIAYISGTEFYKPGRYVFYGISEAGNTTGEYEIVIDRTIKSASISNVIDDITSGDVVITWTAGEDAEAIAPIISVTVNDKPVTNGSTIYTIDTGNYIVKVIDAAGNEWQTEFGSTKKNVLTDTLVKEFFEIHDINGDLFAFATYNRAFEFAFARENSKVKMAEWTNSTWDTGIPMDVKDSINAKNGTYYIYYKSGNSDELVAYFTIERLNEVIAEYAKVGIESYYYWEKAPATAGPNENLYSYSLEKTILAKEVMLGENIGVTIDGKSFVGDIVDLEGKHVMVISDSYGNSCEYNLVIIREMADIFYTIGEGNAMKVEFERTYYFKDSITISIADEYDEMAMFNIYDKDGNLIGNFSIGETVTLAESGSYTAECVNHMGISDKFKIVISKNSPEVSLNANEETKQLIVTVKNSIDDESHLQTLDIYKSNDGGNTWSILDIDDYGTAIELGTFDYRFRTSGMYKVVLTDEFRTGMDSIICQVSYTQPAPFGILEGVSNGGYTNGEVTFAWTDEAKVTVTKDGEIIDYGSGDKLTEDAKYVIVFENFDNSNEIFEFVIDTKCPDIAIEGHKANLPVNTDVVVNFTEENLTAVIIKDGNEICSYVSGTPVTEEGAYTVRVTDLAQNTSEVAFEIDKSVDVEININDGGLANSVTIKANEEVLIELTKDGQIIEYEAGKEITEPAEYSVKITDALMNCTELSFTVVPSVSTGFTHNFDETKGFEKVIINGEEARLNYGSLELRSEGDYEVGVIVDGTTYTFNIKIDTSVDYDINVHNKGIANSVKLTINEDATFVVTMNGEKIEYELGTELTEPASYTIRIIDSIGNSSEMSFVIIDSLYATYEYEIDVITDFEKVMVNGEKATLEKGTVEFTKTGFYVLDIVAGGKVHTATINIDATAPTLVISGTENGGITKDAVILSDISEEATIKVMLNDEEIEYTLGEELTEAGVYKVTLTDSIGNANEYTFEIEKGISGAVIAIIVIASVGVVGAVVVVILKKRKVF